MQSLASQPPSAPVWIKGHSSRAYPEIPTSETAHYDVAVVGGGIVGVTTAYLLKQAGKKVALIEGRKIGQGTTGSSTAKLTAQHNIVYTHIRSKYNAETAKLYGEMQIEAIQEIARLVEANKINCEWRKTAHCVWTSEEKSVATLREEGKICRANGWPVDLIENWSSSSSGSSRRSHSGGASGSLSSTVSSGSPTELPLSIGVKAALRWRDQYEFNPFLFCQGLAQQIPGHGCAVFEHSMINDVSEPLTGPHRLSFAPPPSTTVGVSRVAAAEGAAAAAAYLAPSSTSDPRSASPSVSPVSAAASVASVASAHEHCLTADRVVLATHLPFKDISGHFAFLPCKRSLCIVVRLKTPVLQDMYISLDQPIHSLRVIGDDRKTMVVSGEGVSQGTETTPHYEALEEWTKTHFPVEEILAKWSAMDYMSGDHLPYIGLLNRKTKSLYTATGFSKWGLSTGVAAAMILRDLVTDIKDNKYIEMVDARRWEVLKTGGALLEESKNVMQHFLGDKLAALRAPPMESLKRGEGGLVKAERHGTVGAFLDDTGAYHVVKPVCTHMGCHLMFNQGDRCWDCPCHGSRFDIDGQVLHGPACKDLEKLQW